MSKKRRYNKKDKFVDTMSVHATLEDVTKGIKVVQADLEGVKKLFKEAPLAVSDIKDKIIVVKLDYTGISTDEIKEIHKSLYAVNTVLFNNNSAFVILPNDDHITSVSVDQIDGVIKSLEALKEKINENNSNVGL